MKNILKVLGVQDVENVIKTAVNGKVALELVQKEINNLKYNRFDLIFMD